MKLLQKDINRRIGQAMHTYGMLANGDRVMIAVSGGIDSLILAWILDYWRRKAPIFYEINAVHLDMGFGDDEYHPHRVVANQLEQMGLPHLIERTDYGPKAIQAENGKSVCYHCARLRRNRLFEIARQKGFTKIAFGHHRDDILETFFLNLLYGGNLSTMMPRQDLFNGRLTIIRPLAFVDKDEIRQIAARHNIEPVKNPCGRDGSTKRQEVRNLLTSLYRLNPRVKPNLIAALGNIRQGYLPGIFSDHPREKHANAT